MRAGEPMPAALLFAPPMIKYVLAGHAGAAGAHGYGEGPMRRRRVMAALGAAAFGTVTGAASTGPAHAAEGAAVTARGRRGLRVATYNIAAGAGANGVFDLARTARTLAALDADLIGLQEVDVAWNARSEWRDLASELAEQLGMSGYFGPIYSLDPLEPGQSRREFGVAVLSRSPILTATNHEITRLSTQVPDPVPAPAPGFPEVLVRIRGAVVQVYCTHLDYRADPSVRELQVADMRAVMAERRRRHTHQLLLGDLNATPDAPELGPLWNVLDDAWREANGDAGGFSYPAAVPDRRIDFVTMTRGLTARSVRVPETLASDHRPVVADLVVRRGS